jgi:hypothetical protein
MDVDQSGTVDTREFENAIHLACGEEIASADIEKLFYAFDRDGVRLRSLHSCCILCCSKPVQGSALHTTAARLARTSWFFLFEAHITAHMFAILAGNGVITYDELYAGLQMRRAYRSELMAEAKPVPPLPRLTRKLQHRKAEILELHRQYMQVCTCK